MRVKRVCEIVDYRRRYKIYKKESILSTFRVITLNSKIPSIFRIFSRYMLFQFSSRHKFPNNFRNRCLVTGRARSTLPYFKVSRIEFRRLAKQNYLIGVTKSSW